VGAGFLTLLIIAVRVVRVACFFVVFVLIGIMSGVGSFFLVCKVSLLVVCCA